MSRSYRVKDIESNLITAGFWPLDVLVIGSTGAGKSSTINAMFQKEVAKVGRNCDPETMSISSMKLNDAFRLWDSPGLGDDVSRDQGYAKDLKEILTRDCYLENKRYGFIDMVLVILDGSGRDMGTTNKLLNEVVAPNFPADRILIAINQADMAMKGRHWDYGHNCPDVTLTTFLNEKANSVSSRLEEATGIKVKKPVYFSAEKGYNVDKLMDLIIDGMPKERRKAV